MYRKLFLLPLITALLLTVSCKKGDDGLPGTANVRYSEWFTPSPWQKDTVFGIFGFKYFYDAPGITQNVLDSGVVLTFGKLSGYNPLVWPAGQIGQLPINLTYNQGGTMTDTWSANATPGKLRIRFVNDKNYYASIATGHQFRYIIIPGGLPAGRASAMSYEDICNYYNIPK